MKIISTLNVYIIYNVNQFTISIVQKQSEDINIARFKNWSDRIQAESELETSLKNDTMAFQVKQSCKEILILISYQNKEWPKNKQA